MKRLVHASVLATALAGCGGEKIVLRAQPLENADVRVTPIEVYAEGKKLWVRVQVQNTSNGTLVVQRDAMTAHLPNGQTLPRAMGTYGLHNAYVLPPGMMHPVYVEFEARGFEWKDVPSAQIDFTGAITRDGQPLIVPPFVVGR